MSWGCVQGHLAGISSLKAHQDCSSLPVRPKLNVKPSVMKPALQLKPAQKRRGAQRSAVAAVKPLNSSTVPEQETVCSSTTPQFLEFFTNRVKFDLIKANPYLYWFTLIFCACKLT